MVRFRVPLRRSDRRAQPKPAPGARGRERGSVAVESILLIAFVLIPMAFLTIEVTYLIRSAIAVTSMSREGARVASSLPRVNLFEQDAAEAIARSAATLDFSRVEVWVYRPTSSDGRQPATCGTSTCVRFSGWVNPVGATPGYFSAKSGSWNPTSINACLLTSGTDQRDFVGIYVKARHDWVTKAFPGTGTDVTARSVLKFEPILVPPATVCR